MNKKGAIIQLANAFDEFTKAQAVEKLKHCYYYNAEKYVGEILSRMVNAGELIRIKPGVFKKGSGSNIATDKNQIGLF